MNENARIDFAGLAERCQAAATLEAQRPDESLSHAGLLSEAAAVLARMGPVIDSVPEVVRVNRLHSQITTMEALEKGAHIMADRYAKGKKGFATPQTALREWAAGIRKYIDDLGPKPEPVDVVEQPVRPALVLVKG